MKSKITQILKLIGRGVTSNMPLSLFLIFLLGIILIACELNMHSYF